MDLQPKFARCVKNLVCLKVYFLFFILLFAFVNPALGIAFPNEITDEPEIECSQDSITIKFLTSNGLASRVFAKGHHDQRNCYFENTNDATFSLSNCNMQRQRQLEPRGLSYGLVVVIQLHPLFITKVDRAYSIKCFYMEAEKAVSSFLDVSMITTEEVTAGHAMPQCMYVLHSGSPNGPAVRYARVGEKVWHVWDCPSDVYGMLVHSCFVLDGSGSQIQVIDENGCGVDQYVIRTPNYSADLTRAQQETHVFKFADRLQVQFNCQVKLCFKNGEGCQGITPPSRCGDSLPVIDKQGSIIEPPDAAILQEATAPSTVEVEISTEAPAPATTEPPETTVTTEGTTVGPTTITQELLGVIRENPESASVTNTDVTQFNETTATLTDELTSESLLLVTTSTARPVQTTTIVDSQAATTTDIEDHGEGSGESDNFRAKNGGSLEAPGLVAEDLRGRRNVIVGGSMEDPIRALLHQQEADVEEGDLEIDLHQEMFVLEPQEEEYTPANRHLNPSPILEAVESKADLQEDVCLSTVGFCFLMGTLAVMIIICSAALIFLCRKSNRGLGSLKSSSIDSLYSTSNSCASSTAAVLTRNTSTRPVTAVSNPHMYRRYRVSCNI